MTLTEQNDRFPFSAWGVSFAVHGVALCVAAVFATQIKPVLKEEVFQWDVAFAEPSREMPQAEAQPSTPTSQPSKPTPVQTVQAVEPPSDMVMTRVASQYSPEIVHPTIAPPKPEQPPQPVQQVVQAQPKPVEPQQEVKKEEVKEQEVAQAEPVVTAQPYELLAAVASPSMVEHHAASSAVANVTHAPSVAESATASPASPLTESVVQEAAVPKASAAAVVAAPTQPQSHAPVVASAAPVRPATKADNAWLAESLGRRIKELTRYPSSARLNGSEGKVVLRVILRADGHLSDVTVHRSSGHEVLDRAAMETVRLACPIHMKQALSAAEVAVYVPIVYSLAG